MRYSFPLFHVSQGLESHQTWLEVQFTFELGFSKANVSIYLALSLDYECLETETEPKFISCSQEPEWSLGRYLIHENLYCDWSVGHIDL